MLDPRYTLLTASGPVDLRVVTGITTPERVDPVRSRFRIDWAGGRVSIIADEELMAGVHGRAVCAWQRAVGA